MLLWYGRFPQLYPLIIHSIDFQKIYVVALAGLTQWIEGKPANQQIAGSIPSEGTCLGCWQGPQ